MRLVLGLLICSLCFQSAFSACVGGSRNGQWEEGEECDIGSGSGNPNNPQGIFNSICSSSCTLQAGWFCFQGGPCVADRCGDGIRAGLEECDYDIDDYDYWNDWYYCDEETCTLKPGFKCSEGDNCDYSDEVETICGDGRLRGDEDCDDGNLIDDDGCDHNCYIEDGFDCIDYTGRSQCRPICGDNKKRGNEECDDEDNFYPVSKDGCSSLCKLESGY